MTGSLARSEKEVARIDTRNVPLISTRKIPSAGGVAFVSLARALRATIERIRRSVNTRLPAIGRHRGE